MAKAHLTTKTGTTILIEGSPKEVVAMVKQIEREQPSGEAISARRRQKTAKPASKPTPVNLISSLIDGGFFRKPKDLGSVKVALEEIGHFYPVTTLSPVLLRLVRK